MERRTLLNSLPERRLNPLWRVLTYIDRRVGLVDPARQRRRQRSRDTNVRR